MFYNDNISQKNIAPTKKFSGKFGNDPIVHASYWIPRMQNSFLALEAGIGLFHGLTLNGIKLSVRTCD